MVILSYSFINQDIMSLFQFTLNKLVIYTMESTYKKCLREE